ncbi:MAG: hypothetical protein EAZ07_09820 [Cytophagales bacterium]|nr:MAG: hypothetical protein EAZ07_09820 [Cytophagales bacterium]
MSSIELEKNRLIKIDAFLFEKLLSTCTPKAKDWLVKKTETLNQDFHKNSFFLAYSASFRFLGKDEVIFSNEELETANNLCSFWNPQGMKQFEIARLILFLRYPITDKIDYFETINKLFGIADMGELAGLYRSLILYPFPEDFQFIVADGLRSNIKVVFESIALNNYYPSLYLNEGQWNQMILKSIFNGSPLNKIIQLDQRANPTLSRQLSDYANERWAAGRTVNPELWRVAAAYTDNQLLEQYKRLFSSVNEFERKAAALACATSKSEDAIALFNINLEYKKEIETQKLNWLDFSNEWYQSLL